MYRRWNKEEDTILINNVGKMSYKNMENLLPGRKESGIRQRALQHLEINNSAFLSRQKFHYDKNYWSIPNVNNSYWAGFMCADGCIGIYGKTKNRISFQCGLAIKDKNHLQAFSDSVDFTGKLNHAMRKSPSSENILESVHLRINSAAQWLTDLDKNFNIIPNKTLRIGPPNLWRDEFLFSFLCGYLDGDGCISKINDGRVAIVFTSSSLKMLGWIQDFIDKRFPYQVGKQTFLPTQSSEKCWRLGFSGYKSAMIFNYMKNIPVPKLSRKWDNPEVIKAVEIYKNKKPELFNIDLLPSYNNYLNL